MNGEVNKRYLDTVSQFVYVFRYKPSMNGEVNQLYLDTVSHFVYVL